MHELSRIPGSSIISPSAIPDFSTRGLMTGTIFRRIISVIPENSKALRTTVY
jgi:hypothetical protein